MSFAEMRLLRLMSGMTRENRIRNNERIYERHYWCSIVNGQDERNTLQWFGHVMKRKETKAVRVVIKINVEGKKEERSKKRWLNTIENDMRAGWPVRSRCRKLR
jgi:disulfide oxidoreductase YuzD